MNERLDQPQAMTNQGKREHLLFLTGKLAEKSLARVLESMAAPFTWSVHQLGLRSPA